MVVDFIEVNLIQFIKQFLYDYLYDKDKELNMIYVSLMLIDEVIVKLKLMFNYFIFVFLLVYLGIA
jgi:hypothetical protein